MAYRMMRQAIAALGFAALALTQAGTATAQDAWPTRQITFVVGLGPGGSADRTARALAQRLQDEIGVPIQVINQEGGGGHVGNTYFMNMPDDGSYFLATSIHPYIANAILDFDADYTMDDFAFINGQWNDRDLFAVNAETPYTSLAEFMQAAKDNPGTLRISVVPNSSGAINLDLALAAFGVSPDMVNIVTYQSGGAARTAVAGGQVEMTVLAADGTISIAEFVRPLAVVSDTELEDWDAPTLNAILAENGMETVPVLLGSMRGLAAHATFRAAHPELFDRLVEAYRTVLADPVFVASMQEQDIGTEWLGPEATTALVLSNFEILRSVSEAQN